MPGWSRRALRGRPSARSKVARRAGRGRDRQGARRRRPRLEVDEVARREGRPPPGHERVARPKREMAPLAGLDEEVVEPVEGDGGRFRRRGEAVPLPGGRASWRTTTIPSRSAARIRWRVDFAIPAKTPSSSAPASEQQGQPMARRLDLLDRAEAGRRGAAG